MSSTPTSNYVMDAAAQATEGTNVYVSLTSDGTANVTTVNVSSGLSLGLVQGVVWKLNTESGLAHLLVDTVAAPADVKALLKDTLVEVRPKPGYHPFRYLWDWYATKVWLWFNRD